MQGEQPDEYLLEQNRPNPFCDKTELRFAIAKPGMVRLVIHNLHREQVRLLHDGWLSPGRYKIIWTGDDDEAGRVKEGMYVYSLQADGFVASRRLEIRKNSKASIYQSIIK